VELVLGQNWRVKPSEALLKRLRELAGADRVQLRYEPPLGRDRNNLA
jgi:hypothetical protein